MADETAGQTESAVTEAPARAESAPTGNRFPDLNTVYGTQDEEAPDQGVSKDAAADADDEPDEEPAEGSADTASKPADAPPGDTPAEKPLSRRERLEQERQAEIEAARTEAQQAKDELATIKAEQDRIRQEAIASLGDDARFGELHEKHAAIEKLKLDPEVYMEPDELAEYHRLLPQRSHAAALMGMAREALRAQDQAAVTAVVKEFGLEPAQYVGVDPAVAIKNAITATEARVRQESADRIAQLEASEKSLATQLGGRSKEIGPGGRSDAGVRHVGHAFDPNRSPHANLNDAFATPANGRGDT